VKYIRDTGGIQYRIGVALEKPGTSRGATQNEVLNAFQHQRSLHTCFLSPQTGKGFSDLISRMFSSSTDFLSHCKPLIELKG
jgi:hypothetical protein